ncbi:Uncharacterized protein Fot_14757 [Forsythia ovata]|uniref:Uncharacterized protein n=1 Tax=Forsythia ovata TaxID=205694 RepID=A0ABD1W7A0_9LAMI
MDKSWVHMHPCTKEFDDGLKSFIEHAFAHRFICVSKRCFGRATFLRELLNIASNRDNAKVRSLKENVVDVEEELKSTKEELKNMQKQCSDLKTTTNALQDSLKATMDELALMRGYFRLFLADGIRKFITYVIFSHYHK